MIVDSLDNLEFYKNIHEDIYLGLKFIKGLGPDVEPGTYTVSPTAKAIVMEYATAPENSFGYETHQHVIDVQYCIVNTELIRWAHVDTLTPYIPYDEEKDRRFYHNNSGSFTPVLTGNSIFAVFYPSDGHAPQLCLNEPEQIKKVVIKIQC